MPIPIEEIEVDGVYEGGKRSPRFVRIVFSGCGIFDERVHWSTRKDCDPEDLNCSSVKSFARWAHRRVEEKAND